MAKKRGKMHKVMHEFKHGGLRRGTGKPGKKDGKVTDRKQAIAIGLSEARKAGEHAGKAAKAVRGKGKSGGASKAREHRLARVPV